MSEFSIEEKANAYDLALNKAKTLLSKCKRVSDKASMIYRAEDIESIFPELKEFSDEEIKKWLIAQLELKSDVNNSRDLELMILKSIEWLEKQNESSIKWNKNTPGNKPSIYHSILMKTTHGIAEGEWRGENWCQYRWSTNHIKDSDVLAWMELSDLDRQSKSADKVEPKFKVGDFIVNDYCRGYVIALTNDAYLLNTGQGIPFSCEHNIHLWTIEDAKDGDILVTENEKPFIFKGLDISHSNKPIAYGGIVDSGYFTPSSNNCTNRWIDGNAYPATKEQRDLLFKEIKKAGYKWNKNKKELKRL